MKPAVFAHNEPVLVEDEQADPRVNHFRTTGPEEGSLIVVPLLGPQSAKDADAVLAGEREIDEVRIDQLLGARALVVGHVPVSIACEQD